MPTKSQDTVTTGGPSGTTTTTTTAITTATVVPVVKDQQEVAFLLNGIPVVKFRPEDFVRKPQRAHWSSSTDYIFVSLAFVIGFGNLQFPYLCHKNGGAMFLIPYFLALFLVAIPMLVLEAVLGHLMQKGCLTAWNLTPIFKGVGIASLIMLIWRNAYYIIVSVWSGYYAFHIFSGIWGDLPWRNCAHTWNSAYCRESEYGCIPLNETLKFLNKTSIYNVTANDAAFLKRYNVTACELVRYPADDFFRQKILRMSESIEHLGEIRFELAIGLSIVYGIVLLCVISGIKVLGKLVYPLVLVPFCIMLAMLLRSFGLPGVFSEVFRFYIKPEFMKLLTFKIWIDAFENVLYTFGPGLGVFIALGSYNRNNVRVIRQTCLICIISGVTSFFMGFMVFAYIGNAVYREQAADYFKKIITDDLSLIFAAFPAALLSMGVSYTTMIWTFLFYLMVIFLGLSTQVVAVEALLTAVIDWSTCVKSSCAKRFFLSFVVVGVLGGLGLFFLTNNGIYLYKIFRLYSATSYAAIFVCLMECIVIGWAFGTTELFKKTKFYLNYTPLFIWRIFWIVITPALLLAALVVEIINHAPMVYDLHYPLWCEYIFIWIIIASSILWIFICILCYSCCKRCKCTKEAIRSDYNIRQSKTHEKVPLIKITEVVKPTKPTDI